MRFSSPLTAGFNAPLSAATQMLGVRLDPHRVHNFLIEFGSLIVGGFSEVSGLQVETEIKEYREGGLNEYAHKLPGPTTYPNNLILKHGLTDLDTMWGWHQSVVDGRVKRRSGSIYLLDAERLPVMWWNIKDAYPAKWTGPEFHADSSEVAFESLELVHRGLSKPTASNVLSAGRMALNAAEQLKGTVERGTEGLKRNARQFVPKVPFTE